jgi:hypothetical protein
VENDEYAKELSRDIHLNPARAKRVAYPGDYPGSSFGVYCGEKEAQDFIDFIKKKLKTNANVQQSRPDPTQLIQIRFTRFHPRSIWLLNYRYYFSHSLLPWLLNSIRFRHPPF